VVFLLVAASLLLIGGVIVVSELSRPDRRSASPSPPERSVGQANALPNDAWLNFLAELCSDICFRDAHWMDPSDPTRGAGGWVAHRPFHVREGFLVGDELDLESGYDVRLVITRRDGPVLGIGVYPLDRPVVDWTDYVVLGTARWCGPRYAEQGGPQECVWFVHDFPAGLPPGRYDIRAEWHAPCSAWLELGFVERCEDPDAVASMFDSFVNAEFVDGPSGDPMANREPVWIGRAGIDQTSEPGMEPGLQP
jgi:hypothetical protein